MPAGDLCVVAILGASAAAPPPGLEHAIPGCDLRFAEAGDQLQAASDAEVAYIWSPRAEWLSAHWGWSPQLRWIATSTVGVEWLLFPELVGSDVILTNSAGLFDDAMAEYALALWRPLRAARNPPRPRRQGRGRGHGGSTGLAGSQGIVAGPAG